MLSGNPINQNAEHARSTLQLIVRFLAHDLQQLLGVKMPAQRPKSRAASTGHDDRVQMVVELHKNVESVETV